MIHYKSEEEIALIRESGEILSRAHGEIAKQIKPGVKTIELDKLAEEYINDNGGVPSFKDYNGFPYSLCISLNENVVHGFPSDSVCNLFAFFGLFVLVSLFFESDKGRGFWYI